MQEIKEKRARALDKSPIFVLNATKTALISLDSLAPVARKNNGAKNVANKKFQNSACAFNAYRSVTDARKDQLMRQEQGVVIVYSTTQSIIITDLSLRHKSQREQ
jgi:hypothetical protein